MTRALCWVCGRTLSGAAWTLQRRSNGRALVHHSLCERCGGRTAEWLGDRRADLGSREATDDV